MGRYLLLDIGAGTLDMLCYDTDQDLHYKAVVRSPVRVLADEIRQAAGNLLVTGSEMGGGPVSQALIERAKTADVLMSKSSAATIHHDMQRVAAHGIRLVDEAEADGLKDDSRFHHIRTGDLQPDRLQSLVQGFGVPFEFDAVDRHLPGCLTWISGINCSRRHWRIARFLRPCFTVPTRCRQR